MVVCSTLRTGLLSPERYVLRQVNNLEAGTRNAFLASIEGLIMNGSQFPIGTLCSGSENPIIWMRAVFRVGKSLVLGGFPSSMIHHINDDLFEWLLLFFTETHQEHLTNCHQEHQGLLYDGPHHSWCYSYLQNILVVQLELKSAMHFRAR